MIYSKDLTQPCSFGQLVKSIAAFAFLNREEISSNKSSSYSANYVSEVFPSQLIVRKTFHSQGFHASEASQASTKEATGFSGENSRQEKLVINFQGENLHLFHLKSVE